MGCPSPRQGRGTALNHRGHKEHKERLSRGPRRLPKANQGQGVLSTLRSRSGQAKVTKDGFRECPRSGLLPDLSPGTGSANNGAAADNPSADDMSGRRLLVRAKPPGLDEARPEQ
jgi:hypothetical protein